jgi:4-amino-4-deoxy-L-arabinose transferase-like glycosyltransferase
LLIIVVAAAGLRLPGLTVAPAGLNQDEAANAWNAYCLLETGRDQVGQPWPVFYTRALGYNRSTLYIYLLIPFQALGGLNVWTTRLPNALAGVLSVPLMYWIAARLFDRRTGLWSAGLLALLPWHLHFSRWGHEGGLTGVLAMLPLAGLLWARLLPGELADPPRAGRALAVGLLTGVACYGYQAIRLFIPAFLLLSIVVTWRRWQTVLATRRGRAAVALWLAGFLITFGPLVWQHVAHPEQISRRAQALWIHQPGKPALETARRIAERYADHFGRDFLFERGDHYPGVWSAGFGVLPGFMLPLLILGLGFLVVRLHKSAAARVLLVWLLAYPVGDCLTGHISAHAVRSAPGMAALVLLAALGAAGLCRVLWQNRLFTTLLTCCVGLAFAAAQQNYRFLRHEFVVRNREITVGQLFHIDLMAACAWLKPRLEDADAVYVTTAGFRHPYIITLVGLEYDPRRWFTEPRAVDYGEQADRYRSYGKMHFLYDESAADVVRRLSGDARRARVIFIVREGELDLGPPARVFPNASGVEPLMVYELTL